MLDRRQRHQQAAAAARNHELGMPTCACTEKPQRCAWVCLHRSIHRAPTADQEAGKLQVPAPKAVFTRLSRPSMD